MKALKIVHLISGLTTGGAEMMLFKLLRSQEADAPRQHYVVSLTDGGQMRQMIEELGVPVYSMGIAKNVAAIKRVGQVVKQLRAIQPDIILSWMYHANIVALLLKPFLPKLTAVIWNIRYTPTKLKLEKQTTALIIQLGARLSTKPQHIIYNAVAGAQRHNKLGYDATRQSIIPNGFDLEKFKPSSQTRRAVRQSLGIDDESPIIGMIARYHLMKDHANFLRAAKMLLATHPKTKFVLVGREVHSQNEMLQTTICDLGLQSYVMLLGQRQDIAHINTAFDIFTLSSAWGEGFPNAIGEAMACGIPCVVTDVGDAARLVGKTGCVVSPGDSAALCNAWDYLLSLPKTRRTEIGLAGRGRIQQAYSLEKVVEQYSHLYDSLARI